MHYAAIVRGAQADHTVKRAGFGRLAGFAEQVAGSLDDLDVDGRRRLLRLVVEKIRVTGYAATSTCSPG